MKPEVTFGALHLDARRKAEIREVLRRIIWPAPVEHVEVSGQLVGGGSGAFVGQVRTHLGRGLMTRVIKIDRKSALVAEWKAYKDIISRNSNAFCAPILAITPGIDTGDAASGLAAVVYDHVGQHAGAPDGDVCTLEEVARADLSDALSTVDAVLGGIAHVLHNHYSVSETVTSLRAANIELGPNLVLVADRVDVGDGWLREVETVVASTPHDEILLRTSRGDADDIRAGERLVLEHLRVVRTGKVVTAFGDNIRVEVRARPGSGSHLDEAPDGAAIAVCGAVAEVRGARNRTRLAEALAGHESTGHADPFDLLPHVLTEAVTGQVTSPVHGDLNPRNVVRAADRPYVIDYARTRTSHPQQTDFCWLEIGLFRDVLADYDLADLLLLQRCLALATILLDVGVVEDAVLTVGVELAGDRLATAFRLLLLIRTHARRCYPESSAQLWPREYLRQLYLAAHRSIKWTNEWQSATKLRAAAAAAATATEWLDDQNPFRHWAPALLVTALERLAPLLPLATDGPVRLLASLVRELDACGPVDRRVEQTITAARTRLVRIRCGEQARRLVLDLSARHDNYIELTTDPGGQSAVSTVAELPDVALAGPPGSGKSAVATELVYRLASGVLEPVAPARMPVLATMATDCREPTRLLTGSGLASVASEALTLGSVHLIIDDPRRPGPRDAQRIRGVLRELRSRYPRTPVLSCLHNAVPESTRVLTLRRLTRAEVLSYLKKLQTSGYDGADAEQLTQVLLDDPASECIDLSVPRWLGLIAAYLHAHGIAERMPKLHELITRIPELTEAAISEECRDYKHALELMRGDHESLRGQLFDVGSQDAYRIAVTLPEVTEDVVRLLVSAARDADVVLAAQLLRASGVDAREFAAGMLEVLRDARAGPLRWQQAASALHELGGRSAARILATVASGSNLPVAARSEALWRLGDLYDSALPRPYRKALAVTMAQVIHDVLAADSDPLLEAALELLARTGLPGLELLAARFVDPARPWLLVRRAVAVLQARGTVLSRELIAAYRTACRNHLLAVERGLPAATTFRDVKAAQVERAELISLLAGSEPLEWVLRRRFAFDASAEVRRQLDRRLVGRVPVDRLLMDLRSADDLTVAAAAHRLLRDASDSADLLVTEVTPTAPDIRVLVAAAAVPHASSVGIAAAQRLARDLAGTVDHLEGLAALLVAINGVRQESGIRLAHVAAETLIARDVPERHRWPWTAALARVHGDRHVLDAMLCGDEVAAAAAVAMLASRDFHRSARPGPHLAFSDRARQALLHRTQTADWVLAVGSAGLVEALPAVRAFVTTSAPEVVTRGSARFGLFAQSTLADGLAVAGYLARRAHEAGGADGEVAATHRLLMAVDLTGQHPSVAKGRSIGLAYLGDWLPLLREALTDERMTEAARNVITWWLPGPATPLDGQPHGELAGWINNRLRDENLPLASRWLLEELKHEAEQAGGVLVPLR